MREHSDASDGKDHRGRFWPDMDSRVLSGIVSHGDSIFPLVLEKEVMIAVNLNINYIYSNYLYFQKDAV